MNDLFRRLDMTAFSEHPVDQEAEGMPWIPTPEDLSRVIREGRNSLRMALEGTALELKPGVDLNRRSSYLPPLLIDGVIYYPGDPAYPVTSIPHNAKAIPSVSLFCKYGGAEVAHKSLLNVLYRARSAWLGALAIFFGSIWLGMFAGIDGVESISILLVPLTLVLLAFAVDTSLKGRALYSKWHGVADSFASPEGPVAKAIYRAFGDSSEWNMKFGLLKTELVFWAATLFAFVFSFIQTWYALIGILAMMLLETYLIAIAFRSFSKTKPFLRYWDMSMVPNDSGRYDELSEIVRDSQALYQVGAAIALAARLEVSLLDLTPDFILHRLK